MIGHTKHTEEKNVVKRAFSEQGPPTRLFLGKSGVKAPCFPGLGEGFDGAFSQGQETHA